MTGSRCIARYWISYLYLIYSIQFRGRPLFYMFHPGWNELPRKFPGELSHPRPTNIRHEHGAMAKKMPQRFSKERLSYIYIYTYHPKKTRALFFLSQLFIAQVSPYSTILSRNWLQVWRGRQVERQRRWLWTFPKRQTVLKRMNRIPRILFHVLNSDLSDGLRSWRWRAFGRGVPDFQEASPSRLWKGTSVNQRVMKTFWFSLQKTHLMQRWYLFQLSQLLVDRRNPKEPPGMCKTL